MDWIRNNYLIFDGRIPRSEYIKLWLILVVCNIIVGGILGRGHNSLAEAAMSVYAIFVLIANISISIRRLHDLDKAGWFVLLYCVPVVNILFSLYLLCFKGTEGPNRFGPDSLQ